MSKRFHPYQAHLVEADGVTSDEAEEPPSQQSIYIPPGDPRKEFYRLSTMERFPDTDSNRRKKLAKSGFFFTGFRDRVKCFACGRAVENWEDTDDPDDTKWHKPDCGLKQGHQCGNVPLRSLDGISGTTFMPSESSLEEGSDVQTGEHVDGNIQSGNDLGEPVDETRLSDQSSGSPSSIQTFNPPDQQSQDDTGSKHRAKIQQEQELRIAEVIFPEHRKFLKNLHLNRELDRLASFARWPMGTPNVAPADLAKSGFFYLGNLDRTQCFSCGGVLRNWTFGDDVALQHARLLSHCKMISSEETRNEPVNAERNYPCSNPRNPGMKDEKSRCATFDVRWPKTEVPPSKELIASSGFFYLGEGDRTKCWYCNGGLQNWEPSDDPWVEHAKWYPTCQFLLSQKGTQFVHRHLVNNAHLPRPSIVRCDTHTALRSWPQSQKVLSHEEAPLTEPQEASKGLQQQVERIMKESEHVKIVLEMGFSNEIVAAQLKNRIIKDKITVGPVYESTAQLLEDVQHNLEKLEEEVENGRPGAVERRLKIAKEEGWTQAKKEEEEERLCKICFSVKCDVVIIPCGHLCCCELCVVSLKNCPVCRNEIVWSLKVFQS